MASYSRYHNSDFSSHGVNGCSPRGMVRENRSPVGRIIRPGKAIFSDEFGNLHELKQVKLLVSVKTGSGKMFRQFTRFCTFNQITFVVPSKPPSTTERWVDCETGEYVYDIPAQQREFTTIYEVTGLGASLRQLCELDCIASASMALNVGEPHFGNPTFQRSVSVKHSSQELFSDCPNVFYKGKAD